MKVTLVVEIIAEKLPDNLDDILDELHEFAEHYAGKGVHISLEQTYEPSGE